MPEGWIKLHRSLLESKVWEHKPFSWGQAWVDLLMLANHKPGSIWPRGIETPVNRGQVGYSSVKLGVRWGWSRTKVRLFLKCLENEQQIEQQNNNVSLVISIINYDKYQQEEQQEEQQKNSRRTAEEQQKSHPPITPPARAGVRNEKNEKNEKNTSTCFSEFWSIYPKKIGKEDAIKAWSVHCPYGTIEAIKKALEWQIGSSDWQEEKGKYIPHPGTYIRGHRWLDEPPVTSVKPKLVV